MMTVPSLCKLPSGQVIYLSFSLQFLPEVIPEYSPTEQILYDSVDVNTPDGIYESLFFP
ncbi:MAG: hypothetical protein IKS93_02190 [Methanobrevibacter sp.]|nr:hypothetical protein [Methanobrevibacter sp.]